MATHKPGDAGVTIDANGWMLFSGEASHKTNDTAVTGTGPETPFGVPGGTIADQRVRDIVDTRNATNVGVAAGPDAEAPRVYETPGP